MGAVSFGNPDIERQGRDALFAAREIFERIGAPYFLSNGTLLGCVRDERLIAHDNDIDVGVVWDTKATRQAFEDRGFRFKCEWGVFGQPGHEITFFTPGEHRVTFDIFTYTRDDSSCWMPLWQSYDGCPCKACHGKPPSFQRMTFPEFIGTGSKSFYGAEFPVPYNYEAFLEAQYGDWRVVDENYNWLSSPKNLLT